MELVFILTLLLGCGALFLLSGQKIFNAPGVYILHTLGLMLPPAMLHFLGFELESKYYQIAGMDGALTKLSMIAGVSFCGTIAGYMAFRRFSIGASLFPDYNYDRSDILTFIGALALTMLSFGVVLIPLKLTGFDIAKAAELVRHERFFAGAAYLKQFQYFANFISGGFLVMLLKQRREGARKPLLWVLIIAGIFMFNLMISAVLGGKATIIFPLLFTVMAYEICVARRGYTRMLIGVVLIASVIVSLQFLRTGVVQEVDKSVSENAYVGLYFVLYDSSVLYLETHNKLHHTELGQDFIAALTAPIPRALWQDKPEKHIALGSRFKGQITGEERGGWPVYGFTEWYTNFGWLGVLIGGVLTGWLLSLLQGRYRDYCENPFSFMIMWNVIFLIMGPWPGGVHSFFPTYYILFIVPLFIFKALSRKSLLRI